MDEVRDEPDGVDAEVSAAAAAPSSSAAIASGQTDQGSSSNVGAVKVPGESTVVETLGKTVAQFDGRLIDCSDVDNGGDQQEECDEDDSDSLNEPIDLDSDMGK